MIAAAANLLWLASQAGSLRRFRRQLGSPEITQSRILQDLLRRNAATEYGRRHPFAEIRTAEEFARRVPLTTYDDLEPWIQRIRQGEKNILTAERVTCLVPTSGSSGSRKLIPFTAGLRREFAAAIGPWISDLYGTYPRALLGPSFWSISPNLRASVAEQSAVPVGFDDDIAYLSAGFRRLVAASMAVPAAFREVDDMDAFFLVLLVCLLRRRDLRLVSVWHPSFFLLLLDAIPRHWEMVLVALRTGRFPGGVTVAPRVAALLQLAPNPGRASELGCMEPSRPREFWPDLQVISCWTDAHAAASAAELARRLPGIPLQPKGLFATEAFITLPFRGLHPVAVGSHFFEFIDASGRILPVEGARADQSYEVVVTTGGGLWRYRLGDRVRVDGFVGRTPSLRFLGRAGNVSDLFGEKLSEEFVAEVIRRLGRAGTAPARFAMLAPDHEGVPGLYTLYWEGEKPLPSARDLDGLLAENAHYAWCRQLGQLRPPRILALRAGGREAYYRHAASLDQKLGEIKPPALSQTTGWSERFGGITGD